MKWNNQATTDQKKLGDANIVLPNGSYAMIASKKASHTNRAWISHTRFNSEVQKFSWGPLLYFRPHPTGDLLCRWKNRFRDQRQEIG